MHLNILSLKKKFDISYNLISFLEFLPSIVAFPETRLKNHSLTNILIPSYSFVHVDSENNAGGEAVYIFNSIQLQLHKKQFHLYSCATITTKK